MRAFLIILSLAVLVAVGLAGGRLLQQQQLRARMAEAEAARAEAAAQEKIRHEAEDLARGDDALDEDDLDDEAFIREALAKRALTANCQVCHEENMYASQRLTASQWKAEVDKMISWGAVLPESDRGPVEEFLTRRYGPDAPPFEPARVALADVETREIPGDPREGTADGNASNGGQLYIVLCASCHGATAVGTELGPALANRAVLTHAEDYHKQVRDGLRKMPAMSGVLNAEQQRDILAWLRGLPYDQPAAAPVDPKS
ncbi:cytochrome c [Paludisphaera sp.]|uniref:cytochrome c n=1 Tax=Paludisphaera sp. TaxID=2017432 RepID=UPI00301E0F73